MTGDACSWPHIVNLELADPDFRSWDSIELLLGADAYASVILLELRRGGPFEPTAQHTRFG